MNGVIYEATSPVTGIKTAVHRDHDTLRIVNSQSAADVQLMMDECATFRSRAAELGRSAWEQGGFWPVYKLPVVMALEWLRQWDKEFRPYMSEAQYFVQKLNTTHTAFRCVPWKIEVPKEHLEKFEWEARSIMPTGANWRNEARRHGFEDAVPAAYDADAQEYIPWKRLLDGQTEERKVFAVGSNLGTFEKDEALAIA